MSKFDQAKKAMIAMLGLKPVPPTFKLPAEAMRLLAKGLNEATRDTYNKMQGPRDSQTIKPHGPGNKK